MPQTATLKSLPAAFRMMKAMPAEDVEGGEDDRAGARAALVALIGEAGSPSPKHHVDPECMRV